MKNVQVDQFGEPSVMVVVESDLPEIEDTQVVIEIKAAGVNPVDAYIRSGIYPLKPELPYTPGFDAAGIVTSVGSQVQHVRTGDRVYTFGSVTGCYASHTICERNQVFPLPDNISFSEGAALGIPYSTAYYALKHRAHIKSGETVLVHGASGSVGVAAIQIGRALQADVYGTAGSEAGVDLLNEQNVCKAYNHNTDGYLGDIHQSIVAAGFDIILEMLANQNLSNDLQMLNTFGRVVVIGNRGTIEIDPRLTMGKNSAILGMSLFNTPAEVMQEMHQELYQLLQEGNLKPVIHSERPLEDAPMSHELVMQSGEYGKIVLIP